MKHLSEMFTVSRSHHRHQLSCLSSGRIHVHVGPLSSFLQPALSLSLATASFQVAKSIFCLSPSTVLFHDSLGQPLLLFDVPRLGQCPGGGGGNSHMKQTRMLVVSLRSVNFGFWSCLGCSGQSTNNLCHQGLV